MFGPDSTRVFREFLTTAVLGGNDPMGTVMTGSPPRAGSPGL